MKKIGCVAVDDEPLALEIIKQFCKRIGNIHLLTYTDPKEALRYILRYKPSIVFLDIEMNDANGIQLAKKLPDNVCLIFTTAYMNYALEGFNLDAVDFLHKPFSFERFKEAMNKALRRISYNQLHHGDGSIMVRQKYNNVRVMLNDILYVEAMDDYSKIYLKNSTMIMGHISLKNLTDRLPEPCFLRIHKSFIVPRNLITSFTRQNVTLGTDITLPIGRQYIESLFPNDELNSQG